MGAIAAGALMAQRQAAQATQQLQQGVSPGVRASGPFAKQIAQAQQGQQRNRQSAQTNRPSANRQMDPRVLASAAAMR
jgi:hypothetical protein